MNELTKNLINIGIEIGPIVLITLVAIIFSRTVIFKSLLVYARVPVIQNMMMLL